MCLYLNLTSLKINPRRRAHHIFHSRYQIDWAAHANHMDDMLGTMLDIHDTVQAIMDWIAANGGYDKNALYVTADHGTYSFVSN